MTCPNDEKHNAAFHSAIPILLVAVLLTLNACATTSRSPSSRMTVDDLNAMSTAMAFLTERYLAAAWPLSSTEVQDTTRMVFILRSLMTISLS